MPGVHRKGDMGPGHSCFGAHVSIAGSPNVFVNGIPVHRVGDGWSVHNCGPSVHGSVLAVGSATVIVNGMGCARIGDKTACGTVLSTGSGNVFAGG